MNLSNLYQDFPLYTRCSNYVSEERDSSFASPYQDDDVSHLNMLLLYMVSCLYKQHSRLSTCINSIGRYIGLEIRTQQGS